LNFALLFAEIQQERSQQLQQAQAWSPTDTFKRKTELGHQTRLLLDIWHDMQRTAEKIGRIPRPQKIANFLERNITLNEFEDVVLATHASATKSKLDNLRTQMRHWRGPVSAALHIASDEDIYSLQEFMTTGTDFLSNISIHVMLEYPRQRTYPHNQLRNLAMQNLGSDYFVALDVDFIPKNNTYSGLVSLLRSNEAVRKELHNRRLFVLPAFAIFPRKNLTLATPDLLPTSKTNLKEMLLKGLAGGFALGHFREGHGPTNFHMFFNETVDKNEFYYIAYSENFEPYVLGYRPGIPSYWTSFRGFGMNKIIWFTELDRAGYLFGVLTDFYVMHLNHPRSFDERQQNMNGRNSKENFEPYLDQRYPK
jgi:hypothetical protein